MYRYTLTDTFMHDPEDIVIHHRMVWHIRAWDAVRYEGPFDIPQLLNFDTCITRFEILPSLIAARIMGILTGPRELEAMLDKQLSMFGQGSDPRFAFDMARYVAGTLIDIANRVPLGHLPRDTSKLFPQLFAFIKECPTCNTKQFTKYYWPSWAAQGTMVLTNEVIDWCMYSFQWNIRLCLVKHRCPLYRPITGPVPHGPLPHGPMVQGMKTAHVQMYLGKYIDMLHVYGHGLPHDADALLASVLTRLSTVLHVTIKLSESRTSVGHVSYCLGNGHYMYRGRTRCSACSMIEPLNNPSCEVHVGL